MMGKNAPFILDGPEHVKIRQALVMELTEKTTVSLDPALGEGKPEFMGRVVLEVTMADGTVMMDSPVVFVTVIRPNADGTRSIMCLDNEGAAKRFLAQQNDVAPTVGSQEK